jgi:dipeptidyl aminopeptidase/acylaminoacyl peptidase
MGASKRALKVGSMVVLLAAGFIGLATAQNPPTIVWQAAQAGDAVAISTDGQLLLSSTKLWSAANGTLIRTFHLPDFGSGVNTVALSPDAQYAAIGIQAFNQNLDLFRIDGALVAGRISAHSNGTTSVAFSPDGTVLASGGRDGTAKLWHVPDMTLIRTLNDGSGYRPRVFAVSYSHDGQLLAVGGQGGVIIFRVSDGSVVSRPAGASSTLSLAFSPDGQILAAGSNATDQYGECTDCSIKLWRLSDGSLIRVIDGNNNGIISIAFSPDQEYIAAGSGDRTFMGATRVWRVSDGTLVDYFVQDPNNPNSYVTSVAYTPDGSLLAFARKDDLLVVTQNEAGSCSGTQPPSFQVAPAAVNVAAPFQCPYANSTQVNFANPVASDDCPGVTVSCNPPSGSTFPVGTTVVNCMATDASGNHATCSFPVNVYSGALVDESNTGNVVLFNAMTGDYRFCCDGALIASGHGVLSGSGCDIAIDQTKGNRRIHISINGDGQGSGTAYVQKGTTIKCSVTDNALAGNARSCS